MKIPLFSLLSVPLLIIKLQIIKSVVYMSVYVSVTVCMCLWTRLRSYFLTNLNEIWQEPLGSEKEELIRLEKIEIRKCFPYFNPQKQNLPPRYLRQFPGKYLMQNNLRIKTWPAFLILGPLHNVWTEEAGHFIFSLLDGPWRVLHKGRWMMNNPKVGEARVTWLTF